jgi:nucleoside-diphosphate-sugar epimerase
MASDATALLVTGASGFIGAHLVRRLVTELPGATIFAQHSPGRTLAVADARVKPVAARLADLPGALAGAGMPASFAGVFHLAAYTPKRGGEEDEAAIVEGNVEGLRQLLAALEGRVERFVFASTLDVYGAPSGTLSEASSLAPETLYGASKVFGEVLVRRWGRRVRVPTALLRLGHIYGPGEDAYQKLIPVTIRAVLAGRPAVQVGDGQDLRDFLYVGDLVAMLVAAWRALEAGDLEPLNLVSGRPVTIGEVIATIVRLAGAGAVERRPASGPPRSFRFDASRVAARLPVGALTSFEDGLRAEIDWFRAAGERP